MSAFVEKIYRIDSIINYRLGDLRAHGWLTALMVSASKAGDGPFYALFGLFMAVFLGAEGRKAMLLSALSCAICICLFRMVKTRTSRKRPFEIYPDLKMTIPPPDRFSFPSGHSMNAFAIASMVGYHFPLLLPPLALLAVLIAASRVFLALHYPTDVIAGAIIGTAVSLMVVYTVI